MQVMFNVPLFALKNVCEFNVWVLSEELHLFYDLEVTPLA